MSPRHRLRQPGASGLCRPVEFDRATNKRQRLRAAAWVACLWIASLSAVLATQLPAPSVASARTWLGRAAEIEAQLKSAEVRDLEDVGVGVTRPRRGRLTPADPVESIAWKVLPPGRRNGYWESYKSEIAAYELDKLLELNMVPPAVERHVGEDIGAAIMWLEGPKSVKENGGKVPSGGIWGKSIRKMMMFDNFICNIDRNAGNILLGQPGELILIDHSRAFITDTKLVNKVERVDAELWMRMQALTHDDLARVLRPWIDEDAIGAMIERRNRMAAAVDKLVKKQGQALVIIR
jgi:hypothetical protein